MCKTLKGSTTESKISNNTLYANKKVTWSALYRFGKKLSNFEPIFTEGFFFGGGVIFTNANYACFSP